MEEADQCVVEMITLEEESERTDQGYLKTVWHDGDVMYVNAFDAWSVLPEHFRKMLCVKEFVQNAVNQFYGCRSETDYRDDGEHFRKFAVQLTDTFSGFKGWYEVLKDMEQLNWTQRTDTNELQQMVVAFFMAWRQRYVRTWVLPSNVIGLPYIKLYLDDPEFSIWIGKDNWLEVHGYPDTREGNELIHRKLQILVGVDVSERVLAKLEAKESIENEPITTNGLEMFGVVCRLLWWYRVRCEHRV